MTVEFSTIYSFQKKWNRIAWGQSNPVNISVTAPSHSQKQQAILLHFWFFLEWYCSLTLLHYISIGQESSTDNVKTNELSDYLNKNHLTCKLLLAYCCTYLLQTVLFKFLCPPKCCFVLWWCCNACAIKHSGLFRGSLEEFLWKRAVILIVSSSHLM